MTQMTNFCDNVTIDVVFPSPRLALRVLMPPLVQVFPSLFFRYFWRHYVRLLRIAPAAPMIAE
jgi:hypothetical protein